MEMKLPTRGKSKFLLVDVPPSWLAVLFVVRIIPEEKMESRKNLSLCGFLNVELVFRGINIAGNTVK